MDIGTERRQHLRETGQLRRAGELKRRDHSAAVTGAVQCIERARCDPLVQAAREHAKTGGDPGKRGTIRYIGSQAHVSRVQYDLFVWGG